MIDCIIVSACPTGCALCILTDINTFKCVSGRCKEGYTQLSDAAGTCKGKITVGQ